MKTHFIDFLSAMQSLPAENFLIESKHLFKKAVGVPKEKYQELFDAFCKRAKELFDISDQLLDISIQIKPSELFGIEKAIRAIVVSSYSNEDVFQQA